MNLSKYVLLFGVLHIAIGQTGLFAQAPTIITNDISGGVACAGATISVSFVATNLPNPTSRLFVVQLSNVGGAFTTPTSLVTGKSSPISVVLPASVSGGDYRLRVVADTTGVIYTPSASFMMLKRPTATLAGDTTIDVGGTATLSIFFSGNGPWTYTFTNTNTGTTSVNPLRGTIQPMVSTIYSLQSVSNFCGTGTVAGSAKVTVVPRINTDFITSNICAGTKATVPFSLTGAFETTGITYTAQLSNATGNFDTPINIGKASSSPINVDFPSGLISGNNYRVRVIASANATFIASPAFVVKPLPTATMSSAGSSITAGESANLNISFTGDAPWTFRLSNNQTITSNTTPAIVDVSPLVTTIYKVESVSNTCGAGTVSGNSVVTVIPRISVANVSLGSVCVGTNISLPFVVTGSFDSPVGYTIQLSDAVGSFATAQNLATSTSSPIAVTIPNNLLAGDSYRLRVVANANATPIPSTPFAIKVRPTATIAGNPTVNFGDNAALTISFTAESPWAFTLSDGTTATADRTPFVINVKPNQTATYLLNSVRNLCGEGSTSGSALVTVIPRLITESPTTAVCAGKSLDVKFSIGGTVAPNTIFQAQLSDSLGNFINPSLLGTGSSSPILGTVPNGILSGKNYRLRVVVVGNSTITTIASQPFLLGQKPTATISGGGLFPIQPSEEVFLVIQFTGDSPWNYTMSDNSSGIVTASPLILTVSPLVPTTYTLKSVSNTCGQGTVAGSAVAYVIITSIEDLIADKIALFPNPLTERLNLKINIPHTQEWQLIDFQGRIWQTRRWASQGIYEEVIDTQLLPVGNYIFRVKVGEQWYSRQVMKY